MQHEKKDDTTVVGKMNDDSKVVPKEERDQRPEKEDDKTVVGKMNDEREDKIESEGSNEGDDSIEAMDNKAATNAQGKNYNNGITGSQAASREGAGGQSAKGALQAGMEDVKTTKDGQWPSSG